MGLLADGQTMLNRLLKTAGGVSIIYTRGAKSITMTAIPGRTVFASNMVDGARIEFGDRDYLIAVADLTFGEPALGDRITEAVTDGTRIFEVMTPNTGEPAWRFSDQGRTLWRVHTKEQRD